MRGARFAVTSNLTTTTAADLAELMTASRRTTLSLFDLCDEAVLHQSPGFGFRPIIWHLAHIGVFEAYWLLQKLNGEPPPDERYEVIFDPIRTPRESSTNLPSRQEMQGFLSDVRERVFEVLAKSDFDSPDPLRRDGYLFNLVLEHEYQHQETLLYLFQMLSPELKTRPAGAMERPVPPVPRISGEMIEIGSGELTQGAPGSGFVYDNELPAHPVLVPSFGIDRFLTTNAEFAEFIKEGGYRNPEFWSEEGWEWRQKEDAEWPLYFIQRDEEFLVQTMFDAGVSSPDHPVSGVNWYEAEAYARFRGKRLPTEAEWERAAKGGATDSLKARYVWGDEAPDKVHCNFNNDHWGTTQVGSYLEGESGSCLLDLNGNVWEWTSTEFAGYPGFQPFPYPEYSQEWFDGDHRVLKGGSWATRAPILRTSFRNFFRRNFRIGFTGIRLANDA